MNHSYFVVVNKPILLLLTSWLFFLNNTILLSFFFFFSPNCVTSRLYEDTPINENLKEFEQGKHRVCLYHEWERPVEQITTLETFHTLIPIREPSSKGTENNILLALYEDTCESDAHHHIFLGAHYQSGPGVLHLAAMNKNIFPNIETEWNLPNNCSHFIFISKYKFYDEFEDFKRLSDTSGPSFVQFINENRRIEVRFHNDYGKPVKIYWYENDPMVHLGNIEVDDQYVSFTFLGHVFIVLDAEDDFLIDYYLIDGDEDISIVEPSLCDDEGIVDRQQCNEKKRNELWNWIYEFWARKRESQNYVQTRIVRNFTQMGFAESRLDDDIFQMLSKFWKAAKRGGHLHEETRAGPVMNQEKSPTYMAYLGEAERGALTDWIKPKLEAWSKIPELEMTSLYGIRQYTRGAILGLHVDTCTTHVISAIINVDSKLDEGQDWPLQIYDHSGQLHEFSMKPGDVIFYESAKNGHARFKPLPGDYYSNVFIHFRPTDHNLWNYDWF